MQTDTNQGRLLKLDDVVAMLGVSRTTVFAYLQQGLPVHRLSARVLRFDQAEVLAWVRNRCSDPAPGQGEDVA